MGGRGSCRAGILRLLTTPAAMARQEPALRAWGFPSIFAQPAFSLLGSQNFDRQFAQEVEGREKRSHGRFVLPTLIGDFDVRRADAAATEGGVEGDPLAAHPDLCPHMKDTSRLAANFAVDEANDA